MWTKEDLAKRTAAKYDIASWVTVNQYVSISWDTWSHMDEFLQRAIALEIEKLGQQQEQSRREQEKKLEGLMSKELTTLKFPNSTGSSIGRFLS